MVKFNVSYIEDIGFDQDFYILNILFEIFLKDENIIKKVVIIILNYEFFRFYIFDILLEKVLIFESCIDLFEY